MLHRQFIDRGYPQTVVNKARTRADNMPRDLLLRDKQGSRDKHISWAIEFTPCSNNNHKIIIKHWHLLHEIPGCQLPPQVGFKQTKNIRNMIIRSTFSWTKGQTGSSLPCRHFKCGRCKICHTVMEGNPILLGQGCRTLRRAGKKLPPQ